VLEHTLPGARLNVLGPLGMGFSPPEPGTRDFLVAGGVGLAPLLWYAEHHRGAPIDLLYGARNAGELVLEERIERSGATLHLASEDGARGTRGYVTAALEAALDAHTGPPPRLLACGPNPMLDAVRRIAAARGLRCWVSLEGEMACGVGACLGCAVAAKSKPFRYVCKDGPVLDAEDLL
jgi:dihydroorotate dehydrogenase electron transfer subunit